MKLLQSSLPCRFSFGLEGGGFEGFVLADGVDGDLAGLAGFAAEDDLEAAVVEALGVDVGGEEFVGVVVAIIQGIEGGGTGDGDSDLTGVGTDDAALAIDGVDVEIEQVHAVGLEVGQGELGAYRA